jgi:drug/metabolite transporter (DMT)-like permease
MSMVALGLALAGVSAVASSSAHALLKSGGDKFAVQAWSSVVGLLLALPFMFWVGPPERILWPWLLAGWLLHTFYYLALIWSYHSSDYLVAYPIARGITPIFTAVLGILLLGDKLDPLTLAGVVIISGGIVMLSLNGAISRSGLLAAGTAGLLNTAFTLVDAKGMRLAADPANFLVWYYIFDGISMPLLFVIRARGQLTVIAAANARTGIASGVMALFAFLPTLIAFRLAPVGAVSAIRATSVIFSLLLGGGLLKEYLDGRRVAGALLVTAGALAIIGATLAGKL